ncbi:hypothetical protein M513_12229 [Trichuris suis]|uniref:Uncharacterized protein n=1 Tax=Trichuris suis TaxID=68888 RepID=A0A085LPH5_9BILA|nr:hypothetical protein M513_12229 [Trichuris suis]
MDVSAVEKATSSRNSMKTSARTGDRGLPIGAPLFCMFTTGGSHLAESRLADRSYGRQVVWPTGRLADRSFGRLVVWPIGRLVVWPTGLLDDRSFGRHVTFLERI